MISERIAAIAAAAGVVPATALGPREIVGLRVDVDVVVVELAGGEVRSIPRRAAETDGALNGDRMIGILQGHRALPLELKPGIAYVRRAGRTLIFGEAGRG